MAMRIGLIVNPVAGIGGRVGLKGSDGAEVQARALRLGAVREAPGRAALALVALAPIKPDLELLVPPGEMGEDPARAAGFTPRVIGTRPPGVTRAEDTRQAARELAALGLDLLLFAGGDGTARDICAALPPGFPCLGIPAGVKIHSAVYATSPVRAGELALLFLTGRARLAEAEVLDQDEADYRRGRIATRLFGTLQVPDRPLLRQNRKAPSPASEEEQADRIAADVVGRMENGVGYILGPGTTTRAIARRLGLEKTLVGVDVIRSGQLAVRDATERELLTLPAELPLRIIVTPIGGQGFLFGRGNQQIGPEVIRRAGRAHIQVVSTVAKLAALGGSPLLVDTGDPQVDEMLAGYVPVVTGYKERMMYRIMA